MKRGLSALVAAGVMLAVTAGVAGAQLQTPYTAYGVGLEAGAVVEASIGGASCGTATVDADGNWLLQISPTAPCSPDEGDTITFTVDGLAAEETVTFKFGGAPEDIANGITLTVDTSSTPPTPSGGDVFSAELVSGINLVAFNGTNVSEAEAAAAGASAFAVAVGGSIVTYIPGAPSFVNATFLAQFPGGEMPAGTLMFVVMP